MYTAGNKVNVVTCLIVGREVELWPIIYGRARTKVLIGGAKKIDPRKASFQSLSFDPILMA